MEDCFVYMNIETYYQGKVLLNDSIFLQQLYRRHIKILSFLFVIEMSSLKRLLYYHISAILLNDCIIYWKKMIHNISIHICLTSNNSVRSAIGKKNVQIPNGGGICWLKRDLVQNGWDIPIRYWDIGKNWVCTSVTYQLGYRIWKSCGVIKSNIVEFLT